MCSGVTVPRMVECCVLRKADFEKKKSCLTKDFRTRSKGGPPSQPGYFSARHYPKIVHPPPSGPLPREGLYASASLVRPARLPSVVPHRRPEVHRRFGRVRYSIRRLRSTPLDRRSRRSGDAAWYRGGDVAPFWCGFAHFHVNLCFCDGVSGRRGSVRMSSGHLVGRRIQPRFNLVAVRIRRGDGELGALVDLSADRTRFDRRPAAGTSERRSCRSSAASP